MKKLTILFVALINTSIGFSQTTEVQIDKNATVSIYSDVWKVVYDKAGKATVYPKGAESFGMNMAPVKARINQDKVKSDVTSAFNRFRADYGLVKAVENPELTKNATAYSKVIINPYAAEHSNLKLHPLAGTGTISESIGYIPYTLLTRVPDSMDMNRVIADCIFDGLAQCPVHAAQLVKNCQNYEVGVGLDFRPGGIVIVAQFREKKKGA
jgi:hypothetical protein